MCPTERHHLMRRTGALVFVLSLAACSGQAPLASPTLQPSRQAPQESGSIEDLIAYGHDHADEFGGLYVDPPGGQSVVMLFTANLEMHHDAVNQIVSGTRTRKVTHTETALTELIESLDSQALQAEGIEMISASVDIIGNQVDLELKTNDPTVELSLELAHAGMLDVTVYPVPGEWANAESGEGWRLVGVVQASGNEAYIVRAATDEVGWTDLWETIGGGVIPAVDFDVEVVVSFAHGMGSSCPELRLDGVVIGDGVVYSQTSDPLSPRACTADLVAAEVYVVALSRDVLAADGFTLRLCAACDHAEELDVTLP
jgi:hypothetical protein